MRHTSNPVLRSEFPKFVKMPYNPAHYRTKRTVLYFLPGYSSQAEIKSTLFEIFFWNFRFEPL